MNGLMPSASGAVSSAVAIAVHEMRARITQAPLHDPSRMQVDAPVICVVHVLAGAFQKGAHVATEVEHLPALPHWPAEQFVEISKLRLPRGNEVPRKAARRREHFPRVVAKLMNVLQ